jgi:hypothetical protein
VNDHLQVCLVAEAAAGGLDAGFGYVLGVEADGGEGQGGAFRDCADAEAAFRTGSFEFGGEVVFLRLPPLGFFG